MSLSHPPPGSETATGAAPRQAAPAVAAPPRQPGRYRSLTLIGLGALVLIGAAFVFYVPGFYAVATDDAYVDAHVVSVVPKVAAYVTALHVDDNSKVRAGDLLVELDPRDYRVAVDAAAADLESAGADAANVAAQLREQQSVVAQAEAALAGDGAAVRFAGEQLGRYGRLARNGFGTTERWQRAQTEVAQARAALQRDQAALDAAKAQIAVLQTRARQAAASIDRQKAVLAKAKLDLSYTRIYAACTGSVADKGVVVGSFVEPGQALFRLVPDRMYVIANYKETQLDRIRPGQPARVRVDAFPGLVLHGHVDSIQRGTGSRFALLPPENATGNFVKVVQRVPVKIALDRDAGAAPAIAPGMSVEAEVEIARPPAWLAPLIRLFN